MIGVLRPKVLLPAHPIRRAAKPFCGRQSLQKATALRLRIVNWAALILKRPGLHVCVAASYVFDLIHLRKVQSTLVCFMFFNRMSSQANEAPRVLEAEDTITSVHQEPENIIENSVDAAWKTYNLLSLDGGGTRGYWSLLALQKLMACIADIEEEDEDNEIHHSFSPEEWPEHVSHVPLTDKEKQRRNDANTTMAKCRAIENDKRYLPCHYFDYIGGSSTGALIAIMLGRFRMTVPDCKYEYERLAEEVFGKPRLFSTLRFWIGNRAKYKAARLEKVSKDVAERRNERMNETYRKITLPSRRGLCRTFATSLVKHSDQQALATTYMIRSYDHNPRTSPTQPRRSGRRATIDTSRSNTWNSGNVSMSGRERKKQSRQVNHGYAQDFEIWEVARAATAAPLYFEPLEIKIPRSSDSKLFTDGGFNYTNNPTMEGTKDIEEAHENPSLGVVVSVGTARNDQPPKETGWFPLISKAKDYVNKATDPERVHLDMEEKAAREDFPYFRLNDAGGLDVELDQWEPKRSRNKKRAGSTTIKTIVDSFNAWASKNDNHRELTNCARELVQRRRARISNASMWERYATGCQYTCRYQGCDKGDFFDREQFRAHLKVDHPPMPRRDEDRELEECRKSWQYQSASGS